jgi:hypothetical protein
MALLLEGLTGEKLIYYRDLPEEQVVDVAEWQQAEQERLIREAKEAVLEATPEIEIDIADAWEPAEVIEETTRTEQYTVYDLDLENLQIVPIVETCVVTEGKPTGRFERRLKQDVRFDSETGKLYRRLTLDDVTLDATPEAASLPQWVMDRLAGHSFRE